MKKRVIVKPFSTNVDGKYVPATQEIVNKMSDADIDELIKGGFVEVEGRTIADIQRENAPMPRPEPKPEPEPLKQPESIHREDKAKDNRNK